MRAEAESASVTRDRAYQRLLLGGVLFVTLIAYVRSLGNGFVFDDRTNITRNPYLGQWSYLWKSLTRDSWWFLSPSNVPQSDYYRPLQNIWFGLHYHLFGLHPAAWHLTMAGLNVLAVWMVFRIAARLAGDWRPALLAALLFGLMPVHAEAIVWNAAIPLPLSAVLELGAFYLFITRDGAEVRNWTLALLLCAGALLSHESGAAFPALAAAYVFLLEAPRSSAAKSRISRAVVLMAPFALEVAAYLLLRWRVLGFVNRLGTPDTPGHLQVLATLPTVFASDLMLLAMPWMAGPAHRVLLVTSASSPQFFLPLAALVIAAAAFFILLRNDPRRRLYLFCAAWIVIAIAPTANLTGSWVQDRYLYLASVGWCVMLADVAIRISRRSVVLNRVAWGAIAALLVVYSGALWNAQHLWHDDFTLFTRAVRDFPEAPGWHRLLAATLERRGDLPGAGRELREVLALDPRDGNALYRLAVTDMRMGRIKDATVEAEGALKLKSHPSPPDYILLARLYDAQGDEPRKEAALTQAESLPGGGKAAAVARAQMMMAHGDAAGAERIMRAATRDYPDDLLSWVELGLALAAQKRFDEALSTLQHAIQLAPNDPSVHILTAQVLYAMGRNGEAMEQCKLVLATTPNDANAKALMARIASAGTTTQPPR